MISEIILRPATSKDAEGLLLAHHSAVHETAAKDYSSEVTSQWSRTVSEDRIQKYIASSLPNETSIVAEIDGKIAGFGSIVESKNELRAVYVHSAFGRRGVGTAILRELESLARARGCTELHMGSSVTAERFYQASGYEVVSRGEHTLAAGLKMACVFMRKSLRSE